MIREEVNINDLASHGLDLVSSLEPAEKGANLPGPLTTRLVGNVGSVGKRLSVITINRLVILGNSVVDNISELSTEIIRSEEITENSTFTVLNHTSPEITEIRQEFIVSKGLSFELSSQFGGGTGVLDNNFLDNLVEILDLLRAFGTAQRSTCVDLIVILLEIHNGINNSAGGVGTDSQVRVFVSKPSTHSTRVGATSSDKRHIIGGTEEISCLHPRDKVSEISQTLIHS